MSNLSLIGFQACGKTSVGRLLAQAWAYKFVDTDRLLEEKYAIATGQRLSCRDICRLIGESEFRALETQVLCDLESLEPSIIATGGGVVLHASNMLCLRQLGQIIYLSTSFTTLLTRLQAGPVPSYIQGNLAQEVQTLFACREPLYRGYADRIIETEDCTVEAIVTRINKLGLRPTRKSESADSD